VHIVAVATAANKARSLSKLQEIDKNTGMLFIILNLRMKEALDTRVTHKQPNMNNRTVSNMPRLIGCRVQTVIPITRMVNVNCPATRQLNPRPNNTT
jgi:hypothetical protein